MFQPWQVLGGHMTSVTHVILNGSRGQLISLSMDKTFRIWDVQRQACLQRLTGILAKGPDGKSTLCVQVYALQFNMFTIV